MPLRAFLAAMPLLLVMSAGCNKQTAYGIPLEPTGDPATQQQALGPAKLQMKAVRRLLRMVPARAEGVLLLDPRQVFLLMGDMERALGYTQDGRRYLGFGLALADAGPVSVPRTVQQLERMGVDPSRPALVFADRREVVALPIKDVNMLRARVATLAGRAPWTEWKEEFADGLRIHVCGGYYRKVACREEDDYLICARRKQHLIRALKRVPYRSRWVMLSAEDKKDLATAAALFFFSERKFSGKGTTRLEPDGLTVKLQLSLDKLGRVLGPPLEGEPTLLGLATGARTDFFARLPLGKLLGSIRGLPAALSKVGVEPRKLKEAISGELLFVDHGGDNKALILASKDRALTQKLLDLLVKALPALPPRLEGVKLPAIKTTRVSKQQGGGYRLGITSRGGPVTFKWDLRLAAGKAGLIIGTDASVKALLERAPGPAAALRKTLTHPVDRFAYGEGSLLALRGILRDPEQILPAKIAWDKALSSTGRLKPRFMQLVRLSRFVLDQLDRVSVGVVRKDARTLQVVARFSTLHRRGAPGDDQARALWMEALKAKYEGDPVKYKTLTQRLARRFPRTRFAARLKDPGGFDAGGAAAVTLIGGVAAPALLKMALVKRTVEATESLDKIKGGARQYFVTDHWDSNGNLLPKRFPASMARTPSRPPCGRTVITPTVVWDRAGWGKLHFALTTPRRYAYTFDSAGTGTASVYTATANGDLDCDGVLSTFEIRGSIDGEGAVRVVGPIISNEIE